MKIHILTDNYFINQRLHEIDKNYYIIFNTNTKKFEIHNSGQELNSYCLTLPFNSLDERTIEYVQKTNITNIDKLIAEIDNQNAKNEQRKNKDIIDKIKESII